MHNDTCCKLALLFCTSSPDSSAGLQVSAGQPQEERLTGGVGGARGIKEGGLKQCKGGHQKKNREEEYMGR